MAAGGIAQLLLASALAYAAVAKLLTLDASAAAVGELLALRSRRAALSLTAAAGALEIALAGGLVAQERVAAAGGALALTLFAALQARTLVRRGVGVPCGCFGPRSTVTRASASAIAAAGALAWAIVVVAPAPIDGRAMGWAVAGVLAVAAAAAAGVARELARRVAVLERDGRPAGALEIASEGPPIGAVLDLPGPPAGLRLAVFLSPACALCRELEPAVAAFGAHPALSLTVFDEERDPAAWSAAAVPGSPYAVARDASGIVLAKGAFNTVRQLESVCATAQRRASAQIRPEHERSAA